MRLMQDYAAALAYCDSQIGAAGIEPPAEINGVKQAPLQGVSMVYSFDHPEAPFTHHSQYFEMLGNRAFYEDGWIAPLVRRLGTVCGSRAPGVRLQGERSATLRPKTRRKN